MHLATPRSSEELVLAGCRFVLGSEMHRTSGGGRVEDECSRVNSASSSPCSKFQFEGAFPIESIFYIRGPLQIFLSPPAFTDSCVRLLLRRDEQMASTMSRTASLMALLALPVASFITSRSRRRRLRPPSPHHIIAANAGTAARAVLMAGMDLPVGSLVALATPMRDDGAVDIAALRELLRWHKAEKTDGVVILGTTGEASCLSSEGRPSMP